MAPAAQEFQVVGLRRQHARPDVGGGRYHRQVCKARKEIQLAQNATHCLPDLAKGLSDSHHLHNSFNWKIRHGTSDTTELG